MGNVSDKVIEIIKTHIVCSITFFSSENPSINEIMWKNIIEPYRQRMTLWRMRIACWVPKVTNTHSRNMKYLLLSTATVFALSRLNVTLYVHYLLNLI